MKIEKMEIKTSRMSSPYFKCIGNVFANYAGDKV